MTAHRIGLLGAGSHSSQNHGPAWRDYAARHPGAVELVSVCDLDAERARQYADRFGFAGVCTDLQQLFDAGLDGLVAVTPMELTESLATRILHAGIAVVIEKPPGVGVEGARRLLQVAEQTGTPHMISFNRRFAPALVKARDWMSQGGHEARHVISRMLRKGRLEPDFARDTGLHQVDAVLSVVGPASRVIGYREAPAGSPAANYTARIETATGATASIVQTPDVGVAEESMEILGDGFRAMIDFQHGNLRIDENGETVVTWAAADDNLPLHEMNGAYGETAAFVAGLSSRQLAPTMADGVMTMQAVTALQRGVTWTAPTP